MRTFAWANRFVEMAVKKNYKNGSPNFKHGETTQSTKSPEYVSWSHMHDRCRNPKNKRFANYGGRGISVCGRWNDFILFLLDMGRRPSLRHTLDRRNNNGNYGPGNCQWATRKEQNNNQSHTRLITAFGQTLSISEWARQIGITRKALSNRLSQGMHIEDALTKRPVGHGYKGGFRCPKNSIL